MMGMVLEPACSTGLGLAYFEDFCLVPDWPMAPRYEEPPLEVVQNSAD